MDISYIFNELMKGNSSVLTTEAIGYLNSTALSIYNIPELNSEEVDILKKIIMICNVLYNRTDMTVLPIEDGFYDVLLEKYKKYDSSFQVGSAIVEFKNFIENDLDITVAKQAIHIDDSLKKAYEAKDEIHKEIYDNITKMHELTRYDFSKPAIYFDNEYISKREHNTEHNHPSLVGTLDKCKFVLNQDAIDAGVFNDDNVKILERDFFQDHINKGIINPNEDISIICELKYDGISVEADCGLEVVSARTRGDTGIGVASDISPILKGYTFKNAGCMIGEDTVGVKFEAIITKTALAYFNKLRGRSYVNCRSAIVGLFGASDAGLYRDLITLVPLALDRESFKYPINNRIEEVEFINKVFANNGQPLRYAIFTGNISELLFLIKAFLDEAKVARDVLDFMYDGIVVSYLDENIRNKLGRKNFINKYSMAVKFNPLEKQTIFRGYTYEVGQHGNITPMIHYDPVEFFGTIHTKSTGSSLKRFQELDLKYGDFINITYVNDVMPYVSRVECEHNRNNTNPKIEIIKQCPICGSDLVVSDSGKTLLCPNIECPGRSTQRMVNMFQKLNIKGFSDAAFKALGKTHLYELPMYSELDLVNLLGEADGKGFYSTIRALMTEPIKDYIIMGALGFSSIAHKKWQTILLNISIKELYKAYIDCNEDYHTFRYYLSKTLPGLGEVTCNTIAEEWNFFRDDIAFIVNNMNIVNTKGSGDAKMQIRFSGVRNSQLAQQLITAGYDADDNSSITKKTDILLVPYDGFTSGKVEKAKMYNTKIVPIDEFMNNIIAYIGEDILH